VRRRLLAANWKMHKTVAEAVAFAEDFLPRIAGQEVHEIAIAPPFTALGALGRALEGSGVRLAAQNVHDQAKGAFTGEISPAMLAELGCTYAVVGHSERRQLFGESNEFVGRKAAALLAHGIRPIVCVGETLEEREAEHTFAVLETQLSGSLALLSQEQPAELVIAYEPVWAIGTGRTATPAMAQHAHAMIRRWLHGRFGSAAESVRIQYGGSVKPDNAAELLAQADIDGALVGGASLEPDSFARIVHCDGTR